MNQARRGLAVFVVLAALVSLLGGCAPRPAATSAEPPRPAPTLPLATDLVSFLGRPAAYRLPPALPAETIISDVLRLHERTNGATYNCYFGNVYGRKLYAVAVFPELSKKLPGKRVQADLLRAYLAKNQALLTDPRCDVGMWYDADASKITYLDVSCTLADRAQAIALGKRYNQEAIFSLADGKEIKTGGTGDVRPGWPPINQRLPSLPEPAVPMPAPILVPAT